MLARELIKVDCSWEMSYDKDTSKNYKPNINAPKDDDPTMKQKAADQQTDQAAEDYKRQAETPLLAATRTAVIELVKETLNMHPQAVETPLLAATRTGVIELVKEILNMHPQAVLAATRTRVIELVKEILNMHPQAVETPLLAATRKGVIELVKEILNMHPQAVLAATRTRVTELVKEILNKRPQAVETPLLAAIRSLLNDEEMPGEIDKEDTDDTEDESEMAEDYKHQVETPLLAATRTGVIELVKEILKKHPQAVEHVSHNMQNISHVAASYRRRDIFELVKKIEIPTRRLIMGIDKDGYSVLHHVADNSNYNGGTRPGPAYQLQEELEWFQMVEEIMPSYFTQHHDDKDNMTAKDLFRQMHEKQLEEAQKWIKETSQLCSGVAFLVATLVYAAAFTVPGGNNDKNGLPILIHSPFFLFFTVMDVVSLCCSLTSVLIVSLHSHIPVQAGPFPCLDPSKNDA
ncbi:hypothetical protein LWI28_001896 [Acer negundo]|uniref:PGG domain-containing protein n=1 Tax=Acer negundo TaxID=4023 RepID=A0AAD5JFQ3_ACENE|nr:hypothetical protein LWI28_001896 [Acer negundo]